MSTSAPLTWIELNKSHLEKNIASLTKLASGRKLAVSVKANAYGHGLEKIVGLLVNFSEVDYVTVHSVEEAVRCRKAGWSRKIMMVGPLELSSADAVLEYELEPVITTIEVLQHLGKAADRAQVRIKTHLKLETGTNRQGITEAELSAFAAIYGEHPYLERPYGAATHFANIEDTTEHEYAEFQLDRFRSIVQEMARLGIEPEICHTACSAALILFEETRFDLVRPGISMYGYWSSKETYLSYKLAGGDNDLFEPVLSWKTRITQIKEIPTDSFVGYGCTYRTTCPTRLAILPIGYSDGYDRRLSNIAHVLINSRRAPVRGRVCMNLIMVDITDIDGVALNQVATLIGRDGQESITANQIAQWAETINYETLARLNPLISRRVVP